MAAKGSLSLLDPGTVTVDNSPDNPVPTASATETGTWGYKSGSSGTLVLPIGAKVLQITATSTVGGSFTINDGDAVLLPPNASIGIEPKGNLVSPVIVFSNTSGYFVEYVV